MLFDFPVKEPAIPGLRHFRRHVTPATQAKLLETIDHLPWQNDLKRRVQQYGYRYDYRRRGLDPNSYIGPLPEWSLELVTHCSQEGLINTDFNQLIVNEYLPGQGISFHIDSRSSFSDTIFSVSLGSPCIMTMRRVGAAEARDVFLEPGDVLIMSGEARHDWQHGITPRKTDKFLGQTIRRGRRVSLTFRRALEH
jgi:alkylated DNA repair dioxygenase AlkB